MIAVILYHSIVFWGGNWFKVLTPAIQAPTLGVLAKWLNSFHVYGFTLVSGYIFRYLKLEKGRYQLFAPFVVSKVKRLIVPYLFTCVAWVIPISYVFYRYTAFDIVKQYVLGTSPSQLWFLLMLFWVYILGWICSKVIDKGGYLPGILCIASYIVGILANKVLPNLFMIWTAFTYFPCFIVGMQLRKNKNHKENLIVLLALDVALFILSDYLGTREGTMYGVLLLASNYFLHIIGAVAAFSVFQRIANVTAWKTNKVVSKLIMYSMTIYLFHQQFIYFAVFAMNGKISPYIHGIINFIVAILGAWLVSYGMSMTKITQFLTGHKEL